MRLHLFIRYIDKDFMQELILKQDKIIPEPFHYKSIKFMPETLVKVNEACDEVWFDSRTYAGGENIEYNEM